MAHLSQVGSFSGSLAASDQRRWRTPGQTCSWTNWGRQTAGWTVPPLWSYQIRCRRELPGQGQAGRQTGHWIYQPGQAAASWQLRIESHVCCPPAGGDCVSRRLNGILNKVELNTNAAPACQSGKHQCSISGHTAPTFIPFVPFSAPIAACSAIEPSHWCFLLVLDALDVPQQCQCIKSRCYWQMFGISHVCGGSMGGPGWTYAHPDSWQNKRIIMGVCMWNMSHPLTFTSFYSVCTPGGTLRAPSIESIPLRNVLIHQTPHCVFAPPSVSTLLLFHISQVHSAWLHLWAWCHYWKNKAEASCERSALLFLCSLVLKM